MKLHRFCFILVFTLLAGCAEKGHGSFNLGSSDSGTQKHIYQAWASVHSQGAAPTISVSENVVSLTGTLDSTKDRIDAVRAAWEPKNVVEVVNELQVPNQLTKDSRRDRALAIKLRTRLIFDSDIVSTHYSIEASDGTIYLMGFARDDAELARVKQLAADTVGTGKVVSYVDIRPTDQ